MEWFHGADSVVFSRKDVYLNVMLVMLISFLGEASRGLVIPSKWPYIESMGGDRAFYGYAVATFSVTRMVGSISLGYLADRFSTQSLSFVCILVCLLGNLMYSLAALDPVNGKWVILASRGVIGLGSSVITLVRSHIAIVSPAKNRTRFYSWSAAASYCGIALLPGLGSVLSYVDFDLGDLPVNGNTSPGLLLVVVYVLLLALIFFAMHPLTGNTRVTFDPASYPTLAPADAPVATTLLADSPSLVDSAGTPEKTANEALLPTTTAPPPAAPGSSTRLYMTVAFFIFVNFSARVTIALIETTGTPMFLEVTHHSINADSIAEASRLFFYLGLGGLFLFPLLEFAEKYVPGSLLLDSAFLLIGLGCFLQAPFNGPVPYPQFIASNVLVWSIGSPVTQVLVVSGLVGILGGAPPGKYMGMITAGGSLARIVGPIFATNIDYVTVFSVVGGLSFLTALLLTGFYLKTKLNQHFFS